MEKVAYFIEEWHNDSPYIHAKTSGSTGTPKDIKLLKSDMGASAKATNTFFGLNQDSRAALPLSPEYIAGKMMIVRSIVGNYRIDVLPVSNTIELPDNGMVYDIVPIVPSQIPSLIARPEYSKRIRNLLIGGASPSQERCNDLINTGYSVYISYGMTETCSHVALADGADPDRIFSAMPGIAFDSDSKGRLIIVAPNFSFKRLQTNDVVELLSPTDFKWLGRADNVINSGGLKLYPEKLEELYSTVLKGYEYYVFGKKDIQWGEAAVLVVEGSADKDKIMNLLRKTIDHRMCPKDIICIDELPRTSNGKIKRTCP